MLILAHITGTMVSIPGPLLSHCDGGSVAMAGPGLMCDEWAGARLTVIRRDILKIVSFVSCKQVIWQVKSFQVKPWRALHATKSLSNYRFCNVFLPNSVKCENRTKSKVILALIYCAFSMYIYFISHMRLRGKCPMLSYQWRVMR